MAKSKNAKGKGETVFSGAAKPKDVPFNKNGKYVQAMIGAGINAETTVIANAVVATFAAGWRACKAGEMMPAHASDVLKAIHAGVAKARGEKASKNEDGARVSDTKTGLSIFDWKCRENLVAVLNTIDTLTFEKLIAIVRWMRGTPKQKAHWRADLVTAPSKAELVRVMTKTKTRKTKTRKSKRKGKGETVFGMPGAADRGLGHVVKCAKIFDKAHAKHFAAASDRKLMAGVLANLAALWAPTKALMTQRAKDEAAKVTK